MKKNIIRFTLTQLIIISSAFVFADKQMTNIRQVTLFGDLKGTIVQYGEDSASATIVLEVGNTKAFVIKNGAMVSNFVEEIQVLFINSKKGVISKDDLGKAVANIFEWNYIKENSELSKLELKLKAERLSKLGEKPPASATTAPNYIDDNPISINGSSDYSSNRVFHVGNQSPYTTNIKELLEVDEKGYLVRDIAESLNSFPKTLEIFTFNEANNSAFLDVIFASRNNDQYQPLGRVIFMWDPSEGKYQIYDVQQIEQLSLIKQ